MQQPCRLTTAFVVSLILVGTLPGTAKGQTATHACLFYPSPGTATVTCTFSYPTNRILESLLWTPMLPTNWTLGASSGDGAPESNTNAVEIVFTGDLTNNPISFTYQAIVPAGEDGDRYIRGLVEYQMDGMLNPSNIWAQPDPLVVKHTFNLVVISEHDAPIPPVGTNAFPAGSFLTNSVSLLDSVGLTQFICTGWTMTGNDPVSGPSTNFTMTLTNNAVLPWQWAITNPVPVLLSIDPTWRLAGSGDFTLTAYGLKFVPTTVLHWNGSPRPTTFVSTNQLTAAIPGSDILLRGTADVNVVSPPLGGGPSETKIFVISGYNSRFVFW